MAMQRSAATNKQPAAEQNGDAHPNGPHWTKGDSEGQLPLSSAVDLALRENCAPGTHSAVLRLLQAYTPGRLLDLPAGEGAFAQQAGEQGWQVTAGDCEPLCKAAGAIPLVLNMNDPLPCADGSFEAVVCIDGIEHIERPFDLLVECRRVLTPGAPLVITTPNISSLRSRFRWLLTGFHNKAKSPLDETRPHPLHHINMTSYAELRYQLHRTGFRIRQVTTNRYKLVSWLYAPLAPISYFATRWVFASEESDPAQQQRNREILRELHTPSVLFGETMIVLAERLP